MPPPSAREKPTGWKRWVHPQTYAFQPANAALRWTKRIVVTTLGLTVLLLGIVMIVTPGPAVVVIPAGLAILAVEFAWARRWLRRSKALARLAMRRSKRRSKGQAKK
jgi:uncharacterized protein (TIGR02611 family)